MYEPPAVLYPLFQIILTFFKQEVTGGHYPGGIPVESFSDSKVINHCPSESRKASEVAFAGSDIHLIQLFKSSLSVAGNFCDPAVIKKK